MENRNAGQQSAGQESAVQKAAAQGTAAVGQSSSLLLMGLISLALFGLVVAWFWRFIAAAEAFTFGSLILILLGFLPLLLAVLTASATAAQRLLGFDAVAEHAQQVGDALFEALALRGAQARIGGIEEVATLPDGQRFGSIVGFDVAFDGEQCARQLVVLADDR